MIVSAFLGGLRRVAGAPAVLGGVFALTFAMTLPLALTVRGMVRDHLGDSLAAHQAADAVNYDWWQEFMAQSAGLGTTFTPQVIGFATVLNNISSVADGEGQIAPVAGVLGAYLFVWTFLLGGVIDRYARQRPTRAHGFSGACGVFFLRFLRLAVAAGLLYWFLFAYVHDWLFEDWFTFATQDLDVERTAFAWRVSLYAVFALLLIAVNTVFDYAKIRAVVEDRRSMLGALLAAGRFVARNPGRVFGLYAVNTLLFLVVIGVWALAAPGAGRAGLLVWLTFVLAQAYVMARLFVKLHVIASQTALFQSSLAHAAYTSRPEPVWPESPAAEAIR